MDVIQLALALVCSLVRDRIELAAENLALRQQLAVLREKAKRPSLRSAIALLGGPVQNLVKLEIGFAHRAARDGHLLAPPRIQGFLALEVAD